MRLNILAAVIVTIIIGSAVGCSPSAEGSVIESEIDNAPLSTPVVSELEDRVTKL